ncbi:phospho-sugar mutase [Acetanaerobacterium elongatum]|uniref:Phosphoglucomutase n=1 Tax=Acetanaerobacterium elongatum TaxID=258515 RepID=A0A1G9WMP0_9FIRM|nr:phosphoglucomutase [Acetanaerobacterium elongatum]
MDVMKLYETWKNAPLSDPDLVQELSRIEGNQAEISDRFYRELEFGTGGIRGVLGAGTNRMNVHVIGRATQGLANYLTQRVKKPSVAIAYDSRNKSDLFAKHAACVLAANGIRVHLYPSLAPTPMLSFAVRELKCDAGIIVTASHNPAKYNGYKVYDSLGCQIGPEIADVVLEEIGKVDYFTGVSIMSFDDAVKSGAILFIKQEVYEAYYRCVLKQQINPGLCESAGLKLVYSPLNGAGNVPVREVLKRIGISDVTVVPEQEMPDGNFTTCPFPNPEMKEALSLGLKLSESLNADMLLATDPDSDRVGIAVKGANGLELFTGNEVGALLLEYICSCRIANGTMPKRPVAVKTIVTTELAAKICEKYGVELRNVLTGFKFIGEQIGLLEADGEIDRYILGFEESYGYLAGGYVRDKDAVVASMLICEMAAYYKTLGKSLIDVREAIYAEHGRYVNVINNFECEGESGMARMNTIMSTLRENPPAAVNGSKVVWLADYQKSVEHDLVKNTEIKITLPKSNVLSYKLADGSSFIVRPSGTEPKIKVYYTNKGASLVEAQALSKALQAEVTKLLGF